MQERMRQLAWHSADCHVQIAPHASAYWHWLPAHMGFSPGGGVQSLASPMPPTWPTGTGSCRPAAHCEMRENGSKVNATRATCAAPHGTRQGAVHAQAARSAASHCVPGGAPRWRYAPAPHGLPRQGPTCPASTVAGRTCGAGAQVRGHKHGAAAAARRAGACARHGPAPRCRFRLAKRASSSCVRECAPRHKTERKSAAGVCPRAGGLPVSGLGFVTVAPCTR